MRYFNLLDTFLRCLLLTTTWFYCTKFVCSQLDIRVPKHYLYIQFAGWCCVVCISGVCWDIAPHVCTRERREAASKMDFIIHGSKCIQQSYLDFKTAYLSHVQILIFNISLLGRKMKLFSSFQKVVCI